MRGRIGVPATVLAAVLASAAALRSDDARPALRLEVQRGHTLVVTTAAFSSDDRLAVTGSNGLVTLWDLATSREIYQIHGDWRDLTSVAITDDRVLVVGARSTRASPFRFDLETAKPLPSPHRVLDTCLRGALLITREGEARSAIREAASGRVLVDLPFGGPPDEAKYATLTCSADQKLALVPAPGTTSRGRAELWNLQTGQHEGDFGDPSQPLQLAAISPDGRTIATVSGNDVSIHLWDSATGREVRTLSDHREAVVRDVPASKRQLVRQWSLAFSPDSRRLASGGFGATFVWDVSSGRPVSNFAATIASALAFSNDNQRILIAQGLNDMRVVDVALAPRPPLPEFPSLSAAAAASSAPPVATALSGSVPVTRARLVGSTNWARANQLSPDGRYLFGLVNVEVLGFAETSLAVGQVSLPYLDLQTGATAHWTAGQPAYSVAFTPDGTRMAVGGANGAIELWDVALHKSLGLFAEGSASPVTALALSRDGRIVYAGHRDGKMMIIDASNGSAVSLLAQVVAGIWADDIQLASDGRHLLVGISSTNAIVDDFVHDSTMPVGSVVFVDVLTKAAARIPVTVRPRGVSAFVSGGRSALVSDGKCVALYDAQSGRRVRTLPDSADVRRLAVSPDGRLVATATVDGDLALRDIATGGVRWRMDRGGNGPVRGLAFMPDRSDILVDHADGTLQVLDAAGHEVATIVFRPGGDDWAVVRPDGRFDTTRFDADLPLQWVVADAPLTPVPVDLFMRDYFEPRLLSRTLSGEVFGRLRSPAEVNLVRPLVTVTDVKPEPGHPDEVSVRIEVKELVDPANGHRSGGRSVRLFREQRLVATLPPDDGPVAFIDGTAVLEAHRVHVGTGATSFSVYAFNSDGVKSPTQDYIYLGQVLGVLNVTGMPANWLDEWVGRNWRPPAKGRRAWLVTIGVNTSQVPALALRYAANDARRLGADLSQGLERSGEFERVVWDQLIADNPESHLADKKAIENTLTRLGGTGARPAGLDDLVIISFSGHGYTGPDRRFYLIPADAGRGLRDPSSDPARLLAESISTDELARWLRDIDASHIVLIIDACQSAASVEGPGFKPGPMGNRGLGQLAYDKGLTVLAATQAESVALESDRVGHGLLTYSLTRDGLEATRADVDPRDGKIRLREWLRYAVQRVPRLWDEIQAGALPTDPGARILALKGLQLRHGSTETLQQPAVFDFAPLGLDPIISLLYGSLDREAPTAGPVGSAPPPPPSQSMPVDGNVKPPIKTKNVPPVYPTIAQAARVEGLVVLEAIIGPNGKVQQARVLRSIPLLDQAAIDAVQQWEFTPTLLNGVAVPVVMTVTVGFTLLKDTPAPAGNSPAAGVPK